MTRRKEFQLGWLVGFLEGGGCFWTSRKMIGISAVSTDEDALKHAARLMGSVVHGPKKHKSPRYKPYFTTSLSGDKAEKTMKLVLPHMSKRRQEKIRSVLSFWKNRVLLVRKSGPSTCHPRHAAHGLGLCFWCYHRQWYYKHKKRILQKRRAARRERTAA